MPSRPSRRHIPPATLRAAPSCQCCAAQRLDPVVGASLTIEPRPRKGSDGSFHYLNDLGEEFLRRYGSRLSDCDEIVMDVRSESVSSDQNGSTWTICKRLKNQLEYKIFITDQNFLCVLQNRCESGFSRLGWVRLPLASAICFQSLLS